MMTKRQRYKYEMFVRVRDYGIAHQDVFPLSSIGGQAFAQITATVAAIDEHLKSRLLGRAEAQRVKRTTRAEVFDAMKTLAHAARRAARLERGATPFRIPRRRSLKVDISTARLFIDEAEKRQEAFARLGLPPTFISDFTTLVDALQQAVDVRLSSKTVRRLAQAGIETELARGSELIRDLDVMVSVAVKDDPARFAAWRSARRVEGIGSSSSRVTKVPTVGLPAAESPVPESTPEAAPVDASPAVDPLETSPRIEATPEAALEEVLRRAS